MVDLQAEPLMTEPSLSLSNSSNLPKAPHNLNCRGDATNSEGSVSSAPIGSSTDPIDMQGISDYSGTSTPGASESLRYEFPGLSTTKTSASPMLKPIAVTPAASSAARPTASAPPSAAPSPPLSEHGGSDRSPHSHSEHHAQFGSQKSWARRVQARSEEVRRLFGLDAAEQLMNDFICALSKKVLLQGRLFVFERHLCFYSSLFGYHKVKIVPLAQVVDVRKRKNVGFPNSIEVLWRPQEEGNGLFNGVITSTNDKTPPKREFFTSFVHREDAYKLILGLWAQCSVVGRERAAAEHVARTSDEDDGGARSMAQSGVISTREGSPSPSKSEQDQQQHVASVQTQSKCPTSRWRWNGGGRDSGGRDSGNEADSGGDDSVTPKHHSATAAAAVIAAGGGALDAALAGTSGGGGNNNNNNIAAVGAGAVPSPFAWDKPVAGEATHDNGSAAAHIAAANLVSEATPTFPHTTTATKTASTPSSSPSTTSAAAAAALEPEVSMLRGMSMVETFSGAATIPEFEEKPRDDDPSTIDLEFANASEPAPPLPSTMQRVLTCALPTTPGGFYTTFLSSTSDFFVSFHESQGHHSVKLSPWQRHFHVGPVRDLRFVTPLKGWRIGPPQALCHQTQRYRVYPGDHLVFETSQVMSDIPYSDYFRVDTRWDVTPGVKPGTVVVTVHIAVPFTKNTVWKHRIEKSVTDSSLEAFQMFTQLADKELADLMTSEDEDEGGGGEGEGVVAENAVDVDGVAVNSEEKRPWGVLRSREPSFSLQGTATQGTAAAPASPTLAATTTTTTVAPAHCRTPSRATGRPSSPEEFLPCSHEEWEALLAQVEPQWRGGLRALRRQFQPNCSGDGADGGGGGGGEGIGGGLPRHRRRSSRSGSCVLACFDPNTAMLVTTASQIEQQQQQGGGTQQSTGQQQQQQQQHGGSPRFRLNCGTTAMCTVVPASSCGQQQQQNDGTCNVDGVLSSSVCRLPSVPEESCKLDFTKPKPKIQIFTQIAACMRKRGPTVVVTVLCCVIICLQAAILAAQLSGKPGGGGGWLPSLFLSSSSTHSSSAAAVLQETTVLSGRVDGLQRDAHAWQAQVEALVQAVAELSQRAQQMAAATPSHD